LSLPASAEVGPSVGSRVYKFKMHIHNKVQLLARGPLVLELCVVVDAFSPPRDASGPFRRVFTRKWVIDMETALDLSLESEILWYPRRRKHKL
jgi:hypothetical protein